MDPKVPKAKSLSTSRFEVSKRAYLDDFRNHAHSSLLWCALVLCISPIAGGWLVDHCPIRIRFPTAAATIALWKQATPQPDILLLGSSRLGSFVRTEELSVTTKGLVANDPPLFFNSTIPGGEPITLEFVARRLLASRSTAPRLVVLETNADLLARDNAYFAGVIIRLMTAADLPKFIGDIMLTHDGRSRVLSSRLIPFFGHRSHLLTWMDKVISRPDVSVRSIQQTAGAADWAALRPDALWEQRMNVFRQKLAIRYRHYQLEGATASAFEGMVASLHARGCKVVLVKTPLSSPLRALFTRDMQNEFEAFVQRLRRSYGCEFFDYSDKLPDTFFSDPNHANAAGRSRFTELLAHEVVAPTWRKLEAKPENNQAASY